MHWKHSEHQIVHTILANCHTFDEAYRVLRELEEDRTMAIDTSMAESLRAQAKVVLADLVLADESSEEHDILRAKADIAETDARRAVAQPCLDAARIELDFIKGLIELVNPHRKFQNLPDALAHQACQSLEWKMDLLWKAYIMKISMGHLPYDHMLLIDMHPDSGEIKAAYNHCLTIDTGRTFNPLKKHEVFAFLDPSIDLALIKPSFLLKSFATVSNLRLEHLKEK